MCPGELFELTCTTTDSDFFLWNLTIPQYNISQRRTISTSNLAGVANLTAGSSVITFDILSMGPLSSRLSIGAVGSDLNGTIVMCIERSVNPEDQLQTEEATISVIPLNTSKLSSITTGDVYIIYTQVEYVDIMIEVHVLL